MRMPSMLSGLVLGGILALAAGSAATPLAVPEFGSIPERHAAPDRDVCYLHYYDFCSGWVLSWQGYCSHPFAEAPLPPRIGTVFDLSGCSSDCRHLTDIWWATKHYASRAVVDVEVYCADAAGCSAGPPLGGIYGLRPLPSSPWVHVVFDELPLCACDGPTSQCFAVIITYESRIQTSYPYSDVNSLNVADGCEDTWRCTGHSYVYRNAVDYCAVYGAPAPLWVGGAGYGCTGAPAIPPGCHGDPYDTGFYAEWVIDCYVTCLGPSAIEETTWSQVKRLYE
jgi:hypothetical protein